MSSCTNCGAYTKYEGGLCYDCNKKFKSKPVEDEDEFVPTGTERPRLA